MKFQSQLQSFCIQTLFRGWWCWRGWDAGEAVDAGEDGKAGHTGDVGHAGEAANAGNTGDANLSFENLIVQLSLGLRSITSEWWCQHHPSWASRGRNSGGLGMVGKTGGPLTERRLEGCKHNSPSNKKPVAGPYLADHPKSNFDHVTEAWVCMEGEWAGLRVD